MVARTRNDASSRWAGLYERFKSYQPAQSDTKINPRKKSKRSAAPTRSANAANGTSPSESTPAAASRLRLAVFAFASATALWASFAPVGFGWLAWFAPAGWLLIAARKPTLAFRDYFILWASGAAFWLATLQGIRLAYWPLYFGWIALALYLAVYIPLFVGATRILHVRGILGRPLPLVIAAPIAWVGFELIRSYMLTGYCANMLVHTQVNYPIFIQLADQFGGYGVSFVLMSCCAAIVQSATGWQNSRATEKLQPIAYGLSLLVATIGYGALRLREADRLYDTTDPLLTALLVQENMPTMFEREPNAVSEAWTRYLNTTFHSSRAHLSAAKNAKWADLVVWPESTFSGGSPVVESSVVAKLPQELTDRGFDLEFLRDWEFKADQELEYKVALVLAAARGVEPTRAFADGVAFGQDVGDRTGKPETPYLLLGTDALEASEDGLRQFNSALMVGPSGQLLGRYDKMHLVMFGEYIPLGPALQWLADMFGLMGATPGQEPKNLAVGNVQVAPNICFESMMPRVISGQIGRLTASGNAPDLLINVTNDSWFRGSSMLQHHLACSIVCAVENRRPMLVAANSGISAEIDGCGRIRQQLDRFEVGGLWAEPHPDARAGLVQLAGYPLAWVCALITLFGFAQFAGRRATKDRPPKS